jgi:hypothetical protein
LAFGFGFEICHIDQVIHFVTSIRIINHAIVAFYTGGGIVFFDTETWTKKVSAKFCKFPSRCSKPKIA